MNLTQPNLLSRVARTLKTAIAAVALATTLALPAVPSFGATAMFLQAQPDQAPATEPATTSPATTEAVGDEVPLTATITEFTGRVQFRLTEDQKWAPVTVGQVLPEGAELRTGPESAVKFTIPGGQTVTVDRLSTAQILTAVQNAQSGKITTNVGMKYGRTRFETKKAGVEYSSTIRSPGATLAIRGTDVLIENSAPFPPSATSLEGRAEFINRARKATIAFGGTKKADIRADKATPGQTVLDANQLDPKTAFAGRDAAEQKIITELPGLSGLDVGGQQSVVELAKTFGTNSFFGGTANVPGPLSFNMIFVSTAVGAGQVPNPTVVDLSIMDPNGQTLSKNNQTVGSGTAVGKFLTTNTGDIAAGIQSGIWDQNYPQGQYKVTVSHATGDAAQVFISVRRKEQVIKEIGLNQGNPLILLPGQTFNTTVDVAAAPDEQTPSDARKARKLSKKNRR